MGSEPTSLALLSRGAGCWSGVSFYLLSRLDGQNWIYCSTFFRTDQVKPGHMQLLLLRSAFFFLLREIFSVRMTTSEFGSIIVLNKESLHLISVDPIWKFEIVWCESQETKLNAVRHIFNSLASCRCFEKNILHWALKETNYRSISDEYRCDFTVIYSFFRPWVTPFISPLKSRDSQLKILINEWSEIFDSHWALKAQRKQELIFARQVLSKIFKAKLDRE